MDTSITYHKDEKVEDLNEKISDILSEAFYSYILRKGLLKRRPQANIDLVKKDLEKYGKQ